MRRIAGIGAAIVLLLGMLGAVSIASAAPKAPPEATTAKTLQFDVVFSPFFYLDLGDKGPSLGDELVFHDLLFSHGKRVGEDGGSCVLVEPARTLVNCTLTFSVPGGQITAQGLDTSAATKQFALTGGTGSYQRVRGQGTVVEFGNGTGSATFHLLP
jgi:hypothetical protein